MSLPRPSGTPSHFHPCQGDSIAVPSKCACCNLAKTQLTHHVPQMLPFSCERTSQALNGMNFSTSASVNGLSFSQIWPEPCGNSNTIDFSQFLGSSPDRVTETYFQNDILAPIAPKSESSAHNTPSTVPDSLGRTPAPMKTPRVVSFSYHLSYVNEKLLDHASGLSGNIASNHETPRFPPGLVPERQDLAISFSQETTVTQLEQRYITYPHSQSISGVRRTRSKMLRDGSETTPPENDTAVATLCHETEPSSDAKRRKLCQYDSTASAHTFTAKEPASLRKARSLAAGDTGRVSSPPAFDSLGPSEAPPIIVPTISPKDAALSRLRALLSREVTQRADDRRFMLAAERPGSLQFDGELRFATIEWLLSIKPQGDENKILRRHLRASLETRFHAVWLFSRYAIRLPDARFNPFLMPRAKESLYLRQIRRKLVQEAALACLAVAAKFHHDFLPPLRPLVTDQFLHVLGEDHPVAFDDFEMVQKNMLKSFDYVIYQPTPQAYLEEIWNVCPTLRFVKDANFDLWRTNVQACALELIEACAHEEEVMSFSVAHLSAAALLEALHLQELHRQCVAHANRHWDHEHSENLGEVSVKPQICVACVDAEICVAMSISPHALLSCRDWVMTIWVGDDTTY